MPEPEARHRAGRPAAIEVRPVRPTEHERLGRLIVAAYRALPGAVDEPDYERELADVAARAASATVLVAVDAAETVLGGVTYVDGPGNPWAERLSAGDAGMRMLAVDPSAQGRGIGRLLVEAVVARARAAGRRRLVLHTTPWMVSAHRLYERLGFRRAPELDWQPLPKVPLRAYVLDLG